jgi:hypothetical protein
VIASVLAVCQHVIDAWKSIGRTYLLWMWCSNSDEVLSQAAIESKPILRQGMSDVKCSGWMQIAVVMPEPATQAMVTSRGKCPIEQRAKLMVRRRVDKQELDSRWRKCAIVMLVTAGV